MRPAERRLLLHVATLGALAVVLAAAGRAAWRVSRSVQLARQSEPYQQRPRQPARRLLVVGDSTAVGTGASTPAHSVAGRIGAAHPQLWIDHRGADGARMADLLQQMQGSPPVDMVLIQAGGNDIIRLGDLNAIRADIDQVLRRARALAPLVVLLPCGNVGNAPFFFAPVSWLMTHRSRAFHRDCAAAARAHGATYVSLFHERADDPFVQEPTHNAADGLHPSDSGYRLWWQALAEQAALDMTLGTTLGTAPAAAVGHLPRPPPPRALVRP